MNRKRYFAMSALGLALSVGAQSVPTHEMYVQYGSPESLVNSLKNWKKGQAWGTQPEDENFFISRVPVKKRFLPQELANPNITDETAKNFCWCAPTGEMTKKWGALPRYNFDGDNFNLWQYVKYHSNWSNGWWRVPGAFNDVAHKNGVQTGCTYFIDWATDVNERVEPGKTLFELSSKDANDKFIYAEKLVDFLHYYGIDGLTFNPEGNWGFRVYSQFKPFLAECHRIAKEKNYTFRVDWYAFVTNYGRLNDNGCKLTSANDEWFHDKASNHPVTDMYFLNYNWTDDGLAQSVATAKSHNRSTFDVYAGFDQQGRGYGKNQNAGWEVLMKHPVSIVVWGAHDRNQLYASSVEGGQSDYAVQNEYQTKQEMLFSGGNRNVLNLPALNKGNTVASYSDLQSWHGYATAVREHTTLDETPFVTRFNLGNGRFMNNEGKTTWAHKWYNIGMQDLLPTWRWWIDNGDGRTVPAQSLKIDFTFDDAWFGGSCLRLHGATPRSDIRLFATKWKVESENDVFTLVYKTRHGNQTHLELAVAKWEEKGKPQFVRIAVPEGEQGVWKKVTFKASEFGLKQGDVIGTVGLSTTGTSESYDVLLGEMSFVPATFNEQPTRPEITTARVLKRLYNRADFKVVFNLLHTGERKPEYANSPIYNEEVGAWYYEVWIKQGGQETLLTTTTSWAAYVVDAPLDSKIPTFQVGVRTVGRDGTQKSEISWSDELESNLQMIENLTIDKAVIKPNETFTIGFEDPNHPAATIRIYNALTNELVKTSESGLTMTTTLPQEGSYDVEVEVNGKKSMNRSLILITPEATGRMPQISDVQVEKTEHRVGTPIHLSADVNPGTENKGQTCTVSQGLYMQEPFQFTVDSKVTTNYGYNTFALWFKVKQFEHASLGTLLMTKVNRNYPGTWTEQVWGEMWTAIRPAGYAKSNNLGRNNAANEISVCFDGPKAGTYNYEHNNDVDGLTNGYSLMPDTWYHLAVVKDGKNDQRIYLNGKEVLKCASRGTAPKDWLDASFYVGGSMTNLASFTGWIDEVQIWSKPLTQEEVVRAMKGFQEAPENLEGYFTFETTQTDKDGNIYFPNLGRRASVVPGGYMTTGKSIDGKMQDIKRNDFTLALGVPTLTGALPIKYEGTQWQVENAKLTNITDNSAEATFTAAGTYDVGVVATNSWGSTTFNKEQFLVVNADPNGIESVETGHQIAAEFDNGEARLQFAQGGQYDIQMFAANGQMIHRESRTVSQGERVVMRPQLPAGTYIVKISTQGRQVVTFKLMK